MTPDPEPLTDNNLDSLSNLLLAYGGMVSFAAGQD